MPRLIHLFGLVVLLSLAVRLAGAVRDTTFQAILEQAGSVRALAALTNGSILVGGQFHRVGALERNALVLTDSGGSPLPDFDAHLLGDATVQSLLVEPDGLILVAGRFALAGQAIRTTVVRLRPDGTRDDTFRLTLPAPFGDALIDVHLTFDPAGRIYLAAYTGLNESQLLVARLEPDGTADPERVFRLAADIRYTQEVGPRAHVSTDGSVILTGSFRSVRGLGMPTIHEHDWIIRLRSDGELDPTFQLPQGSVFDTGGALDSEVLDSALLPDGRLVIGGAFRRVGRFSRRGLAIIHPDGALDLDFRPDEVESAVIRSVLPGPGGILLVGGQVHLTDNSTPRMLVRFQADGRLDPGFAPVAAPAHDTAALSTLLSAAPGRIIAAGRRIGAESPVGSSLAAFQPDGTPDRPGLPTFRTAAFAPVIQPWADGSLFVSGPFAWINGEVVDRFARLRTDGSVDPLFRMGPAAAWILEATPGPEGSLYLSGSFPGNESGIVRIGVDGRLQPGFAPPRLTSPPTDLLAWSGDRLLVAGSSPAPPPGEPTGVTRRLLLLGPDGTVQTNAFPDLPDSDLGASVLGATPDGGFYCARDGWLRDSSVIRIGPNGSLDTSFRLQFPDPNQSYVGTSINDIAVDSANRLIVAGSLHPIAPAGVMRFRADGSVDPEFVPGVYGGSASKVLADPDGGMIVAGSFRLTETDADWVGCVRLFPDGTLDAGFPVLRSVVTDMARAGDGAGFYIGHIEYGGSSAPTARIERFVTGGSRLEWTWSGVQGALVLHAPTGPAPLQWQMSTDLRTWIPVPGAGSGPELSWNVVADGTGHRFFRARPQSGSPP